MARATARFWQEIDDAQDDFLGRVRGALRDLVGALLGEQNDSKEQQQVQDVDEKVPGKEEEEKAHETIEQEQEREEDDGDTLRIGTGTTFVLTETLGSLGYEGLQYES